MDIPDCNRTPEGIDFNIEHDMIEEAAKEDISSFRGQKRGRKGKRGWVLKKVETFSQEGKESSLSKEL